VIRFGRHTAPAEEPAWNDLWAASPEPVAPAAEAKDGRELFVRHARRDGKTVATLRAVDHGSSCVVEAEVSPSVGTETVHPGPYTFADAAQASAFVTEAVAALMYLGCDIQAH
jgi:hypothetical protein